MTTGADPARAAAAPPPPARPQTRVAARRKTITHSGSAPARVTIERPSTSATMPSGWEPAHLDLRGVLRAPLRASDLMGPKVASKLPTREEILKGKF